MAARRKVIRAPGLSRFALGTTSRRRALCSSMVIEGFRVRIRLAEYPDQKPCTPFSRLISHAISLVLESGGMVVEDSCFIIAAVCFRVTICWMGVVKNLEKAPARTPTPISSSAGKLRPLSRASSLFCRTYEYARKNRKLSATPLRASGTTPV